MSASRQHAVGSKQFTRCVAPWLRQFLLHIAYCLLPTGRAACRGGMLLESVTLIPILVLLFVGAMEMGKIALTYYQVQKTLRGAGRMVGVLRGADFCNGDDPQIAAVKDFVIFGPGGDTSSPVVRDLTPDRILIVPERSFDDGTIGDCDCGGPPDGCSVADGGRAPDFVRLSIDGGYPFRPRIPFRILETILLRPHVRVPFGGQ